MSTTRRRWILRGGLVVLAGVATTVLWPSGPVDLRQVDPGELARREAMAWRAYYEERYPTLFWQVFQISRNTYGFSLADSVQLSYHAARSAAYFRRSNKEADIAAARHHMERYYRLISEKSVRPFDYERAGNLELEWWRMRREKRPPDDWARIIADQCAVVYGLPAETFLSATRLRVEAMVYRDAHRHTVMDDTHWQTIQNTLTESARKFREALEICAAVPLRKSS